MPPGANPVPAQPPHQHRTAKRRTARSSCISLARAAAIQASFDPYCMEARVESGSDLSIVDQMAAKLAEADI